MRAYVARLRRLRCTCGGWGGVGLGNLGWVGGWWGVRAQLGIGYNDKTPEDVRTDASIGLCFTTAALMLCAATQWFVAGVDGMPLYLHWWVAAVLGLVAVLSEFGCACVILRVGLAAVGPHALPNCVVRRLKLAIPLKYAEVQPSMQQFGISQGWHDSIDFVGGAVGPEGRRRPRRRPHTVECAAMQSAGRALFRSLRCSGCHWCFRNRVRVPVGVGSVGADSKMAPANLTPSPATLYTTKQLQLDLVGWVQGIKTSKERVTALRIAACTAPVLESSWADAASRKNAIAAAILLPGTARCCSDLRGACIPRTEVDILL